MLRVSVPNWGNSRCGNVRAHTARMPLALLQQIRRFPAIGLARSVVSRSLCRAAMAALSHVIWATISCVRRALVPARRFCSAVRMTISCCGAPKEARQLCVWASGSGRGVGRITSAKWARGPSIQGIRLANWPVAGQNPGPGAGLTTTTGRPAVAKAQAGPCTLQAASGLPDDEEGRLEGLDPVHEGQQPLASFGTIHRSQRQGQCPIGLSPHQSLQNEHALITNSCPPDLANTGSMAPDNCTGSGSPERDDPRYAPVSADQG